MRERLSKLREGGRSGKNANRLKRSDRREICSSSIAVAVATVAAVAYLYLTLSNQATAATALHLDRAMYRRWRSEELEFCTSARSVQSKYYPEGILNEF